MQGCFIKNKTTYNFVIYVMEKSGNFQKSLFYFVFEFCHFCVRSSVRRELNKKLKKQDQERIKDFKTVPVLHNPVFYGLLRLKMPPTRSVSSSKPAFEPTSRPPSMISTALEFMNHESKISQKLHLSLGLKPPKMFGSTFRKVHISRDVTQLPQISISWQSDSQKFISNNLVSKADGEYLVRDICKFTHCTEH